MNAKYTPIRSGLAFDGDIIKVSNKFFRIQSITNNGNAKAIDSNGNMRWINIYVDQESIQAYRKEV